MVTDHIIGTALTSADIQAMSSDWNRRCEMMADSYGENCSFFSHKRKRNGKMLTNSIGGWFEAYFWLGNGLEHVRRAAWFYQRSFSPFWTLSNEAYMPASNKGSVLCLGNLSRHFYGWHCCTSLYWHQPRCTSLFYAAPHADIIPSCELWICDVFAVLLSPAGSWQSPIHDEH